jgi:hypothetical protein
MILYLLPSDELHKLSNFRSLKSMCIAPWRVRTVIAVVGQSIMSMAMVENLSYAICHSGIIELFLF